MAIMRSLLSLALFLAAAYGCGEVSPRAEVVCYFKGDLTAKDVDPCKCTILVASDVTLDHDLKLTSDVDFTKLKALKARNPKLRLVASIGGENVKTETFSLVTSSVEGVANFTEGVVAFVTANGLDGLEVDWRWPGQNGGSKDKDDVTTLMKVVRLALDQKVHSVSRRTATEALAEDTTEAEDATEAPQDVTEAESATEASTDVPTTSAPEQEDESLGSDYLVLESGSEYEVTLRPEIEVRLEDTGHTIKEKKEDSHGKKQEKTATRPYRGSVKFTDYFKLSGVLTTTETPSTTPSSGWKIAKSSQASERKAKQEVEKERGAILMMTVSPHPEYLVKGYDLKALTK